MIVSLGSTLAVFRLLGKIFPARPLTDFTDETYEELCAEFKWRDRVGNWLGFFFYVLMIAVWFVPMLLLSDWISRDIPKQHYVGPFEFLYLIGACFLSLFSSGYFLFLLYRLVLGKKEYEVYLAYGGEKLRRSGIGVGVHLGKVYALFCWLFMPPLLLLMIAYIDTFTSFTDHGILYNPFWSLGQTITRPYADVRGIYEVKKIHLRNEDKFEPFQVIVFKDGTRWETDHGSLDPKLQMQRDLMSFVSQKSGIPIRDVQFDEDIPAR